ncbi:MAG: M3 family oligoendopeptidase [Alphaproteobacteria bacterium]
MATNASSVESNLGKLPNWDLSDFYSSKDDPKIDADFNQSEEAAIAFAAAYEGKLNSLSGDQLAEAISKYEQAGEVMGGLMSYAYLLYAGDMTADGVAGFLQNARERANAISNHALFFTLELNRVEDKALETKFAESAALTRYKPWIKQVRSFRPHQLSDELETYIHETSVTGAAAWSRLFDETMAELRFSFEGKELSSAEIMNKLSDPSEDVRKNAAQTFGAVLKQNGRLFAQITNTLAKNKEIEDTKRSFERPVSSQNLSNQVEDEVVDALVSAVRESFPQLSHRYFALKAKWMGKDKLAYWDRNAPLPQKDLKPIPWEDATSKILAAYSDFSPELGALGKKFFDNAWIDAPVRQGKAPGAFAHPTVPSVHPYLLVNYQGKVRDVMTLAHELGHGVHQILAGKQGNLMSSTPLTLAETASVFGEMLTFRSLLNATTDPEAKRILLAGKVEDMLNTVVRQISFHMFETAVHDRRRQGELSIEDLNEIWMETQIESLGSSVELGDDYPYFWSYIPHFIHVPFYVYAYAFGDCLVNSLYAVYQNAEDGFAEKYLDMLASGGTKHHSELLAPFGLDAKDPAFWSQGLSMISGFIDELETMEVG